MFISLTLAFLLSQPGIYVEKQNLLANLCDFIDIQYVLVFGRAGRGIESNNPLGADSNKNDTILCYVEVKSYEKNERNLSKSSSSSEFADQDLVSDGKSPSKVATCKDRKNGCLKIRDSETFKMLF